MSISIEQNAIKTLHEFLEMRRLLRPVRNTNEIVNTHLFYIGSEIFKIIQKIRDMRNSNPTVYLKDEVLLYEKIFRKDEKAQFMVPINFSYGGGPGDDVPMQVQRDSKPGEFSTYPTNQGHCGLCGRLTCHGECFR